MIVYYEGSQNQEFLYTDDSYYFELSKIDKEEYDIQPTVNFTIPGQLLNNTKIILRTRYKGVGSSGNVEILDTGDYIVQLDKDFGTRQTEMIYLDEITGLIQTAARLATKEQQFLVAADTEQLVKNLKTRLRFEGEQTTIKFPEESYWLAKLLGAKVFKSNELQPRTDNINGQQVTFDEEGNELDTNGLIIPDKLNNKTMYVTNKQYIKFDYTFYLNFIKTLHITCLYITKQTVLSKYKQYIILRHELNVTPLARVKITSGFSSTITKDQIYKGIQIGFCDENFHTIPMDPDTTYELEISISKSLRKQQLEIDRKTVSDSEYQRQERIQMNLEFEKRDQQVREFELNFGFNREQHLKDLDILQKRDGERKQKQANIQPYLDKVKLGQIPLDNHNKEAIQMYREYSDQLLNKLTSMASVEQNLYKLSSDFTQQPHIQMKAARELSDFYKQQQEGIVEYNYDKLYDRWDNVYDRMQSILSDQYGTKYTLNDQVYGQLFGKSGVEERDRVNAITNQKLRVKQEVALQELKIIHEQLKSSLDKGYITEDGYNKLYNEHEKQYIDKVNRYSTESEKLGQEYNYEKAVDEAYKAWQDDQAELKRIYEETQTVRENDDDIKNAIEEIATKYLGAIGRFNTENNKAEIVDDIRKKIYKRQQEEQRANQQQYQQQQQQYQQQQFNTYIYNQLDEYNKQRVMNTPVEQRQQLLYQLRKQFNIQ
ncbi:Hypothetical_protein [Hexamita inflata]|uniref:Hypothetical_protein n=1 Tax=Hexamita inflata TaxID=28002 RepID=A0AA86TGQ5_9EUKA|nr:Hypothetical protein HINF_LOCUS4710 [Hexamita inflata]CAI9977909.1 Hypothetical protein HINF_LOCUS65554 [Hexamita inflata]